MSQNLEKGTAGAATGSPGQTTTSTGAGGSTTGATGGSTATTGGAGTGGTTPGVTGATGEQSAGAGQGGQTSGVLIAQGPQDGTTPTPVAPEADARAFRQAGQDKAEEDEARPAEVVNEGRYIKTGGEEVIGAGVDAGRKVSADGSIDYTSESDRERRVREAQAAAVAAGNPPPTSADVDAQRGGAGASVASGGSQVTRTGATSPGGSQAA